MRWIKSPAWDLVWVLNPLWLTPLVLLLARGHDDVRASPVDGLFLALAVPLWFGHRVSSAWLAYATPAYRPLLATQRLRFVVAPLAIAVACFGLLLAPESVLPMPLTERVVCFVILTALMLRVELRSQRPSLPRVAYVLGVSAMVLFAFLARDPFLFIVLWSVQHWSAAMGLASLAASGGVQAPGAHWQRLLAPINRRGWAVLLVLAIASTLLLPVMEVQAVSDEYASADRIFGDAARWLRSSPFAAALLALGFATGFIHYLLDRAAFRFSSPDVRRAARGLLQS